MPINEIRDTIQGTLLTNEEGYGYTTRRINLPDGHRHSLLSIDVFNDQNGMWLTNQKAPEAGLAGYQLFVSPYPMQRTNESFGVDVANLLTNTGAMAGDDAVLYKEQAMSKVTDIDDNTRDSIWFNQFPNDAAGSMPTNHWYSNHLYITVFVWNQPSTEVEVKHSLFMRVKQTKVGAAESSMGQYQEFLNAQCRLLSDTAVTVDVANIAGYDFPMWKYGGIRPELMISGTTALRYFNRVASNANQRMTARGSLQTAYQNAKTMVGFDAAFGDAALNLPDWISLMDVGGVTAGEIRPYPPPLKYNDNGNTLMF
tara:strand:+ start:40 stop:975 length:936 start_codon:yes stop_codon:yes gene_type:complete